MNPQGAVHGAKPEASASSDDEGRRFKIVIKHVAEIDLEAVMAFCRTDEKVPSSEEKCLSGGSAPWGSSSFILADKTPRTDGHERLAS